MTREEIELRKAITELTTYHFPGSKTELVTLNGVRRALNLVYRGNRDHDTTTIIMDKEVFKIMIDICEALINVSWESCLCGNAEEVIKAKAFLLAYKKYYERITNDNGKEKY